MIFRAHEMVNIPTRLLFHPDVFDQKSARWDDGQCAVAADGAEVSENEKPPFSPMQKAPARG